MSLDSALDLLYRTPAYVCEITRHPQGIWSSRLQLYPEEFLSMYTVAPPLSKQFEIVNWLDGRLAGVGATISRCGALTDRFKEYRTAPITAAVTGQIDVLQEAPLELPPDGVGSTAPPAR